MKMQKLTARVTGRVQGVGFRYFTELRAEALGVTGWVTNNYDGSVGVEAYGTEEQVRDFLEHIKTGPSMSQVEDVEFTIEPCDGSEYDEFLVR